MKHKFVLIDLLLLVLLAVVLVTYCFRGVTSACDGFMHLSKLRILTDNLNAHSSFPRWNPYWYFGVPTLRLYAPLAYYVVSFFGWTFQLSSVGMVMTWSYLAFSVTAVSTYLLAKELGLKRFGCIASSILFLTSSNLIAYWGIGSYPNVTGVAFSPLALFLFLRAIRKRDAISVLAAGLSFSIVFLVYFMNAIILAMFMLAISVVMVIRDSSLLFIRRGEQMPPKYTLVMPKIFGSVLLITAATSLWWALPFLTTYMNAPAGAADSVLTAVPVVDHLVNLLGVNRSVYSPGVGHVILALIGCIFIFVKRKIEKIYVPLCLLIGFIFCLAPLLHIPTGPIRWFRVLLYFSLFIALCGGTAVDTLTECYGKILGNLFNIKKGKFSLGKVYSLLMIGLVLLLCVYPVFGQGVVFQGIDVSAPEYVQEIESRANFGERLAIDGGYGVNLCSEIFQSGGGDSYDMVMINDFSYTFWYYVFVQKDSAYLPYFSRNYNVRWVLGNMDGLKQTDYGVPEVKGFDASFVEAVGLNETLLLFIGEEYEYSFLFQSQAMINSQGIILVNGGESLEGYNLGILQNFDAVYLNGIMRGDSDSVERQCDLLSEYVHGGGGVILDTGDLVYGGELKDIPDLFPVEETATYEESLFLLSENVSTPLTERVHLSMMSNTQKSTISYGTRIRDGSEILVLDENLPVVAHWSLEAGRVLWTGLRLPYYSNYYGHSQEINEEAREVYVERARFLSEMVNFVTSEKSGQSSAQISVDYPEPEKITVQVEDASPEEGIWVKMTYSPGWTAEVNDEKTSLRIFRAGPDMMLIFPDRTGSYGLTFYFGKTLDVAVGEAVSLVSVIAIMVFFVYQLVLHMRNKQRAANKWDKTRHTGSGNNYINSNSNTETTTKRQSEV